MIRLGIFFIGILFFMPPQLTGAQGTFPIYSDYLSDNIYIIHPTAAGLGNSAKLRLTHRQQWSGNEDAPALQTISFHNRITERMALGGMIFNDRNGFHSQLGVQATYAYHLNFGIDQEETLKQVSFALSGSFTQNSVDQRSFTIPDPVISRIVESDSYFNVDFSTAYFNYESYAYFTIRNLLLNTRNSVDSEFESINLRRYLLTLGHFFGWRRRHQFEPSIMLQYVERTKELTADINFKYYRLLGEDKRVWLAASFRRSFDDNDVQELSQITPIAGIEYKRYLFSYTYTQQLGDIAFQNGGYHQFTLGVNLFYKRPKDRGYIPQYNPFLFKKQN
ncbi:MAG: type IX secretion system membrane protein PorP/SprF [Flavobacteriaceae bacterium]|nr:type IX secretion system membrane protein PorP/SprF [Flavobacteriaceae bacterium]